jgi:hypothetical protein
MSAVPEDFLRPLPRVRRRAPQRPARERADADTRVQKFWQWFAVAALLFCWIAEATMCAERGF